MKVKDLQAKLATLDPEMDVVIRDDAHDYTWIARDDDFEVNKVAQWHVGSHGFLGGGKNPTEEFLMVCVGG